MIKDYIQSLGFKEVDSQSIHISGNYVLFRKDTIEILMKYVSERKYSFVVSDKITYKTKCYFNLNCKELIWNPPAIEISQLEDLVYFV